MATIKQFNQYSFLRRIIILLLFNLANFPCLLSQTEMNTYKEFENTFKSVFENSDWSIALSRANLELKSDPNNINALFLRATANYELKQYSSAINDYNAIIKLDPKNFDSFRGIGLVRHKLEDFHGAIISYSNAIEISETDYWSYYNRSKSKIELYDNYGAYSDINNAIAILSNIILRNDAFAALTPLKSQFISLKGQLEIKFKNYEQALKDFTMAISLDSKNGKAFSERGLLKITYLKQIENGCLDLSRAGELGLSDAYFLIAAFCK